MLPITIDKDHLPGNKGKVFVGRYDMPDSLTEVIKQALAKKLGKLIAANAQNRILLIEKDSPPHGYSEIAKVIEDLSANFTDLTRIDQIWVVDTVAWESENYTSFTPVWPKSLRGYAV
jgi:hypothetical protein